MVEGWVKIHRKILDWEWWEDHNTTRLFIYLLVSANHVDKRWRGNEVKRGEIITSLDAISKGTGLSIQNIRTSLNKLKLTQELTQIKHASFTHLKLNNYNDYQSTNKETNNEITKDQQRANKELTTTKECKNVRMKEINTIVDFFNKTLGRTIKGSKTARQYINARLSEGYTVEDAKRVIEYKKKQWKDDKDMKQYLTLETLFRQSNFDKYLGQSEPIRTTLQERAIKRALIECNGDKTSPLYKVLVRDNYIQLLEQQNKKEKGEVA